MRAVSFGLAMRECPHIIVVVRCCVAVPATIIDELSSDDTTVQEGDVVVLVCNVTGVPRPDVTWYRRPAVADKMAEPESKMCPLRSKGQGTSQSPTYYRTTRQTLHTLVLAAYHAQ